MNNLLSEHYIDCITALNRSERMSIGEQTAFPTDEHSGNVRTSIASVQGMTYRQWLVGMAMTGLLAESGRFDRMRDAAQMAVAYADAVIAELST